MNLSRNIPVGFFVTICCLAAMFISCKPKNEGSEADVATIVPIETSLPKKCNMAANKYLFNRPEDAAKNSKSVAKTATPTELTGIKATSFPGIISGTYQDRRYYFGIKSCQSVNAESTPETEEPVYHRPSYSPQTFAPSSCPRDIAGCQEYEDQGMAICSDGACRSVF